MQLLLGLILIVATGSAIAQQYNANPATSILSDAVQHPSSEAPSSETATSIPAGFAKLPDAPSSVTKQTSSDATTAQPKPALGVLTNSLTAGPATTSLSPISKRYLNLAMPNGDSSLIFIGRGSAATESDGPPQQSDGGTTASGKNCSHPSAEKSEGNGWINSLLAMTSKAGHYCALGEGGFWKRGTYAATRAFAAHKYDGSNSFYTSGLFNPASAGMPGGYNPYQNYAGERLAARYASAIGRDTLKNMFREFWPDISTHMLHRRP